MADKREGFGTGPAEAEAKRAPTLFETPEYRVTVGRLPPEKADSNPQSPFLVRYIVEHKAQRVIYGTAGGLGQAIMAAVQAEVELNNAIEAAMEFSARSYKLAEEKQANAVPRFQ